MGSQVHFKSLESLKSLYHVELVCTASHTNVGAPPFLISFGKWTNEQTIWIEILKSPHCRYTGWKSAHHASHYHMHSRSNMVALSHITACNFANLLICLVSNLLRQHFVLVMLS